MATNQPQITLASASFLRKLLMKASKLDFKKLDMDIDENQYSNLSIKDRVVKTAAEKAQLAHQQNPDDIIIAGDTLTSFLDDQGNEVVEDKSNKKGSSFLNGKQMQVFTATVVILPDGSELSDLSQCTVQYTETSESNLSRITEDDTVLRGGSLGIYSDSPGFTLAETVHGSHGALYGLNMPFIYKAIGDLLE